MPDSENLTSFREWRTGVHSRRNWELDEGLKHTPRERLEAEIHMHQLAHLNLIRNWVGQSTAGIRDVRQVRHGGLGRVFPAQPE